MKNLIIEVDKFYKTRSGQKVRIYAIEKENKEYQVVHGSILEKNNCKVWEWSLDGRTTSFDIHPLDIVSEWKKIDPKEPHPAEKWEVDRKILVSDDGKRWWKRHFSYYQHGIIYVFKGGKSAWTHYKNDNDIPYKYAKDAEEE